MDRIFTGDGTSFDISGERQEVRCCKCDMPIERVEDMCINCTLEYTEWLDQQCSDYPQEAV